MKSRHIRLFVLLSIFFAGSALWAEEEKAPDYGWKNELVGNLNFTQTNFSNWQQGGENNWNWQLDINGKFVNDQEKFNWSNTAKISYGRTKIQDQTSRKSADEVRLESVFTYKMGVYVNPYIAATGQTQFTKGYNYSGDVRTAISKAFDPAYFTESIGVGYEPLAGVKTRLGVALKQTIADEFAAAYSDDPLTANDVETLRSEVGLESVTDFSRKLSQNILFTSKLELFTDFKGQTLPTRDLSMFERIDVRWDNVFSAKVSKFIAVSFNVQLFYDSDISIQRQLKQVLAAGLTYSFL